MGDEGGSEDHPSDDTGAQTIPEALVGVPEESGRGSRGQTEKKRTKTVLEKWAQGPSKKGEGATKKSGPKKRSGAEDNPVGRGFKDLRKMFEEVGSAQAKKSKGREPEPETGTEEET